MENKKKNGGQKNGPGKTGGVWINKDNIICLGIGQSPTKEDIENVIDEVEKILKELKGQGKVLIHTSPYLGPVLSGAGFRKKLAEKTKKVFKEIGFKKIAIFGGDMMSRTITMFIISASGIKDMRVFKKKEKALEWLKQD